MHPDQINDRIGKALGFVNDEVRTYLTQVELQPGTELKYVELQLRDKKQRVHGGIVYPEDRGASVELGLSSYEGKIELSDEAARYLNELKLSYEEQERLVKGLLESVQRMAGGQGAKP